jgi:shikimate kinase
MKDSPKLLEEVCAPFSLSPALERVILTGFMGAGKSTIGHRLAGQTGWDFFDLDIHIEKSIGASAKEIFASLGESGFRKLESDIFSEALNRPNIILAPGGAVIDKVENQLALAGSQGTLIVFLDAPFQVLIDRCLEQERMGSTTYRPLLHQTATAKARYEARRVLYARHAHLTVDVAEKDLGEATQQILDGMRTYSC